MSAVVDKWVGRCASLAPIGSLTHAERLRRALNFQRPDMVPVAPEAQLYSVLHRGRHDFIEVYQSPDAATDAVIGAWYDLRFDLITSYLDLGHELEPLFAPARRRKHFILRGPRDYVVFRPVTTDLDEAISLFKDQVWRRHGAGRAAAHLLPHCQQLAEFQNKTGCEVLVATGAASPSLHAETTVEAQNFVKWLVTEPKQKLHTYLAYVLEERLATLEAFQGFAADARIEFFYCIGGASTWGPRQWDEFGEYDRIYAEKAAGYFELPIWQYPGHNLLQAIDVLSGFPVKGLQFDMPMTQYNLTYPEWFETVAMKLQGKMAALNSPTTQLALYGSPEQVKQMVRDFIKATAPYTNPIVMPGREIGSHTPEANVQAMIDAARTYGKYPIELDGEDESLEDYFGRKPAGLESGAGPGMSRER